ncbi:Diacylglycerol kinase accessory domain family protein [Babesia bovis T2Bo]|uniref:Diacylglycerol kinase accessory domain family protein n=1 Tax=Babesia bovis T2Bo TaxID=484906 RepID=UPI001C3551B7|nr:Diacylglycerol kinase accessory domain family protein [Babesia bovis T2Bo]EDO08039.2 Diacylglycerol kinase accessory domain family protein [Babesia bovis T2Bo]
MEYIYFFVNPSSGGQKAATFFEPNVNELHFTKPVPSVVYIYSITDGPSGHKPGFEHLRDCIAARTEDDHFKVVICGGDGSVMWMIEEMDAHGIDCNSVVFSIVPYGTGNDFARAVHWDNFTGLNPFDNNMLRRVIERLFNSTEVLHDFWKVVLTVEPEGSFNRINQKSRQKETVVDESGSDALRMEFVMGNYFSIGVDARIGRGFDRLRSQSSLVNKLIYLWQGTKNTFRRSIRVDKQIDKMLSGESYSKTVFTTEMGNLSNPVLPRSSALIALNIPSYSAGIDPFARSCRVGLENLTDAECSELTHFSQKMGDHRLEFLAYRKVYHIAADFCGTSLARRVHASGGPWKIVFKELHPSEKVYFQIDGEFYVMLQPKDVEISHSRTIRILK